VLGNRGEQAVAEWYAAHGFEVVARNWRTKTGEIDLVARSNRLVVLCEVKTRSSDRFGAPIEAITPLKVRRMRRLAAEWLAEARRSGDLGGGATGVDLRFDIASVTVIKGGLSVEVIEGVF
jgi:putative endonuclease